MGAYQAAKLVSAPTITKWKREDPAFAAAFKQAQQDRGPPIARRHYVDLVTADQRATILAEVQGGKTLTDVLKLEGMPHPKTFAKHCKSHPEYLREMKAAQSKINRGTKNANRSQERYRESFEPLIAVMREGSRVADAFKRFGLTYRTFRSFLRCRPDLDARWRVAMFRKDAGHGFRKYSADEYFESCRLFALADCRTEEYEPTGLPNYNAMQHRCHHDHDFASVFAVARRSRIERRCAAKPAKVRRPAKASKPVYQTAVLRGRLLQEELYLAADRAVPKFLPDDERDDFKSDLIEGVLLGDFTLEEMSSRFKEFRALRDLRLGTYKTDSLDAKVTEEGDLAFIDRLTTEDYSYAD